MPKLARSAWLVAAFAPLAALTFTAVSACVGDEAASTGGPAPGEDGAVAQDGPSADGTSPPADSGVDATDAGPCAPTGAFGDPVEVPGLHVAGSSETYVRFSDDGLSALINRGPDDGGVSALYLADRATTGVDFGPGTKLPTEVNGDGGVSTPGAATFADAKTTIYFEARTVSVDIFQSRRMTAASSTFSQRAPVSGLSGFGDHAQPYFVNDKLYIFFNAGNGTDPQGVYVSERGPTSFGTPVPLSNLAGYSFPVVTRDELTIFVAKGSRIYEADRAKTTVAFGNPVELPASVSTGHDTASDVSADGCTLYFTRGTANARKLFKTTRAR